MPKLGLGQTVGRANIVTPGIIKGDNLKLLHRYTSGEVVDLSEGGSSHDGTNGSYIDTPFKPDYIHTNATAMMWLNMGDFTGSQAMGCHGSKRWYMGFAGTDAFIGVQNAVKDDMTITPTPVAGEWFHYALVANSGTATVYINGKAQGTLSYTPSSGDNPIGNFTIGVRNNDTGGGFVGQAGMNCIVTNLGQFNIALTQPQIKDIMWKDYSSLTIDDKENLVSWWTIASDVTDSHGSNDGTLV